MVRLDARFCGTILYIKSKTCGSAWGACGLVRFGSSPPSWSKMTVDAASTDCTVRVQKYPKDGVDKASSLCITTSQAVKAILPLELTPIGENVLIAGSRDVLLSFEISHDGKVDRMGEVVAHWHDLTGIQPWIKKLKDAKGRLVLTPMIVSASLDGTVRRWDLHGTNLHQNQIAGIYILPELLQPKAEPKTERYKGDAAKPKSSTRLTEEELDALLESDQDE